MDDVKNKIKKKEQLNRSCLSCYFYIWWGIAGIKASLRLRVSNNQA